MTIASILLAAGRGRRLQPLSDRLPKPAVPMLDIPLGAFGLTSVTKLGPVLVNVSHLGAGVVAALEPFGSFEVLDEQPEPYGSAGTVAVMLDRLADDFVTVNSDVVTGMDPGALLAAHRQSGAAGTISVRPVTEGADIGSSRGAMQFIDRRIHPDAEGFQFLGVAAFRKDAVAALDLVPPAGLGESILRPLAEAGELNIHVFDGYWSDVGTFARYLATSLDLLAGSGPRLPVDLPGRVLDVEGGRAYVGPNATAPVEALGPGAIVLARATVDQDARIQRSIVLPGTLVSGTVADAVWPIWAAP